MSDQERRDTTATDPLQDSLDEVVRSRAMQLGRGNLLIQRGSFATPAQWQARREEHQNRLQRIDRWLKKNAKSSP